MLIVLLLIGILVYADVGWVRSIRNDNDIKSISIDSNDDTISECTLDSTDFLDTYSATMK